MKRILIPGISPVQADFIRVCRERGFEVYTCSNTDRGPGKELSDGFELIDVTDTAGVTGYARRIGADFVYTVGSDVAMPSVCLANRELGLPCFVSPEASFICNNKHLTRKCLGNGFEGNLEYQVLESAGESLSIPYPVVIKPVDSQGQRGVRLARNREEMVKLFPESQSFSRSGKVIAEEYAEGPEISVPAYMIKGKAWCGIIADRISWADIPGWVIRGNRVPSAVVRSPEMLEDVREMITKIADTLEIRNGPLYCQIKLREGRPVLMEVSPRLDGGHLWRMWKMLTGVDIMKILVGHLTGKTPLYSDFGSVKSEGPLELEYFCQKPGERFDPSRFDVSGALYLEWYYHEGETIGSTNGFLEKTGYVIRSTGFPGEGK